MIHKLVANMEETEKPIKVHGLWYQPVMNVSGHVKTMHLTIPTYSLSHLHSMNSRQFTDTGSEQGLKYSLRLVHIATANNN